MHCGYSTLRTYVNDHITTAIAMVSSNIILGYCHTLTENYYTLVISMHQYNIYNTNGTYQWGTRYLF